MVPINSALEAQLQSYLIGQNIPDVGGNVRRFASTGSADLPGIFVRCATRGTLIGSYGSGVYRIPVLIQLGYNATDYQEDPSKLDTLAENVEEALQGAKAAINGTVGGNVYLYSVTMTDAPVSMIVEDTYQYSIQLEAVAKKIN